MSRKKNNNVTDKMISAMFVDYVSSMEDKERHTETACKEVEKFDRYCEKVFPEDIAKQRDTYNQMMDVAVEFEESGFIAGYRYALAMGIS